MITIIMIIIIIIIGIGSIVGTANAAFIEIEKTDPHPHPFWNMRNCRQTNSCVRMNYVRKVLPSQFVDVRHLERKFLCESPQSVCVCVAASISIEINLFSQLHAHTNTVMLKFQKIIIKFKFHHKLLIHRYHNNVQWLFHYRYRLLPVLDNNDVVDRTTNIDTSTNELTNARIRLITRIR